MPPDPFFSRSNQESGEEEAEIVRILGADEAAEAAEREDVARRRPERPRYGDRPAQPAEEGSRPTLRFPLPDNTDVGSMERPRVAPVEPRQLFEERPTPPPPPAAPRQEPPAPAPRPPVAHEERPAPPPPVDPARRGDPGPERPVGRADESGDPGPERPGVISVNPPTGETELPPWTAPPTGEVPRVVIGEAAYDDDPGEQARWSSYATSGPRWRDEHDSWDAESISELAGSEESIPTHDRGPGITQEEYLSFDDLDVPAAPGPSSRQPPAPSAGPPPPPPPGQPAPGRAVPQGRAQDDPAQGRSVPGSPRHRRERDDVPPAPPRDVTQAAFVGVVIAAVAVVLFWLGPAPTMILVVAALVVAAAELFEAFRKGGLRPATLLGLVACACFPLAVYWRGEAAIALVITLTVVFTVLWYMLGIGGGARPVTNIGVTLLGVLYVGLLGSFAALILDIPAEGVSILLVAVIAVVASEVVGFFVGRSIGRTPLSAISPGKTVEGLVGGIIGSMFATFVVAVVLGFGPFGIGSWFVFGLCCAIAAPLGDLAESLMKRDLGVKDMGTILPGHGGVLDRIDGLLLVLPVAYYVVRVLDLTPFA